MLGEPDADAGGISPAKLGVVRPLDAGVRGPFAREGAIGL